MQTNCFGPDLNAYRATKNKLTMPPSFHKFLAALGLWIPGMHQSRAGDGVKGGRREKFELIRESFAADRSRKGDGIPRVFTLSAHHPFTSLFFHLFRLAARHRHREFAVRARSERQEVGIAAQGVEDGIHAGFHHLFLAHRSVSFVGKEVAFQKC